MFCQVKQASLERDIIMTQAGFCVFNGEALKRLSGLTQYNSHGVFQKLALSCLYECTFAHKDI